MECEPERKLAPPPPARSFELIGLALSVVAFPSQPALAADAPMQSTEMLKRLSVEELMNIEVTSVSRTEETLRGAAAAVAIVTRDDIRQSGATNVPEALRLVPGLHVARQTSNIWAISSRGFSSVSSEKLLVLSDTRSIYTPLFSGVLWDVQDYLLNDIDRIEVIRGPGAALWGSNAVNGVINITTRRAQETQGPYVELGAGTEERAWVGGRYGGRTSGGGYYRVFGKYFDRDASADSNPVSDDDWRLGHAGFRADWELTGHDALTVQGDLYDGEVGRLQPSISVSGRPAPQGQLRVDVSGGNILGRWRRTVNADSDIQLRVYYDRTRRNDPSFEDDLDTLDLDFQHGFAPTRRQEMIWGVNYRFTSNRNEGKGVFAVEPVSSDDHLVSGFVQDQISVLDGLRFTFGTKLEHNDFSGFEVQPGVRAAWDFRPGQTVWAAVSRAVRVPTRLERDIAVEASNPAGNPIVRLLGNDEFDAERLVAYEIGYRWQRLTNLSVDVAAFHNRYRGLASLELGAPFIDPRDGRTVIPIVNRNLTDGRAQGVELLLEFAPRDSWHLSASYSTLDLELDPAGADLNRGRFHEGSTPRHQFGLKSSLVLRAGLQLDAQFRRLTAIRSLPGSATGEGLRGYAELDVRVGWQVTGRTEISVVGQNLLHDQHAEFGTAPSRGEIERSVYGKAVWRY